MTRYRRVLTARREDRDIADASVQPAPAAICGARDPAMGSRQFVDFGKRVIE